MYGWWCRCQDDSNDSPTRELEETTRASPYHMAERHPTRSESLQPYNERSSWPGPEPSSVEADVYVWHYALLVVHARKQEDSRRQTNDQIGSMHALVAVSNGIWAVILCSSKILQFWTEGAHQHRSTCTMATNGCCRGWRENDFPISASM